MKLERFRIQNYKSIQDSGWIECDNVLAFIGKNEAGKTSVLQALSKLNSTSGEKYDGLKDFPHGRFSDEFEKQNWPGATARFALSDEEREEMEAYAPFLAPVTHVTFTRYYNNKLTYTLEPEPNLPAAPLEYIQGILKTIRKGVEEVIRPAPAKESKAKRAAAEKEWDAQRDQLFAFIQPILDSKNWVVTAESLAGLRKQLLTLTPYAWVREVVQTQLDEINTLSENLATASAKEEAVAWLVEQMPQFLYFSNYEMLQSSIYLPEFISRQKSGRQSAEIRVQAAMFKHVGANIEKLVRLSEHTSVASAPHHTPEQIKEGERNAEELAIRADSAATSMTKKFSEWWQQKNHRFHYIFHGDFFKIWVSDSINPSKIEFESRSEGFRYFFSLYLLFLVEAQENHKNCILLLDEPGLHLHGRAQEDLLKFFDKIVEDNDSQLFYTTHSPFLVDGNRLDRLRAVTESPEGTTVSANIWPTDQDSLFPVQAALGYSICQSLFISKKQVLLEGATDYMLLTALNAALPKQDKINPEVTMIPVGGATNLAPFASLLKGHGVEFAAVIDSDKAGQKASNALGKIIPETTSRTTSYQAIFSRPSETELEDVLPAASYIDAVNTCYPKAKITAPPAGQAIVDHCKAAVAASGETFEKYRPIQILTASINAGTAAPELLAVGKTIFAKINSLFA
jgi:predicted ATP-dependent endonuclease of OLD family